MLPPGPGELEVRVEAEHAHGVRLFLLANRPDMRSQALFLGEDRDGRDGWSVRWHYADRGVLGRLLVEALGPGGVAEDDSLSVYLPPRKAGTPPHGGSAPPEGK